jgi:hypothetical protein
MAALPPKWSHPQSYSRLLDPIPSVPALRAYRNHLAQISSPLYVNFVDAQQAVEDAEWRLACESWRWCRTPSYTGDERRRWFAQCMIAALRFEDCADGLRVPGKELALRPSADLMPRRVIES